MLALPSLSCLICRLGLQLRPGWGEAPSDVEHNNDLHTKGPRECCAQKLKSELQIREPMGRPTGRSEAAVCGGEPTNLGDTSVPLYKWGNQGTAEATMIQSEPGGTPAVWGLGSRVMSTGTPDPLASPQGWPAPAVTRVSASK